MPPWLWEEGARFDLVDQFGRPRSERDFLGRWWLVYFGYTHCTDVCPLGMVNITRALNRLAADVAVTPVFIATDPKRDTPQRLREFLVPYHPDFVALTGDKAAVFAAAKHFGVRYFYGDIDGSYEVSHTDTFFLMGPDGRLKAYFGAGTGADELKDTIAERLRH